MSNQSFPSKEHLKSRKAIQSLFDKSESSFKYPIKIVWKKQLNQEVKLNQAAFTVPKRLFKRAVDRNLIKRRMREAYRLNKELLHDEGNPFPIIYFMFIYTGKEILDYTIIESSIKTLLGRLRKELEAKR
jgi:ribonuclease P protein component